MFLATAFMTPAERMDVANRTFALDVSGPLQKALDWVGKYMENPPLGVLGFPYGGYRIDHTLFCRYPIMLMGAGFGSGIYPVTTPATQIAWYGPPDKMFIFGANGQEVFTGGGIENLMLDSRQIATASLRIGDCRRSVFRNLSLENATENVVEMVNSITTPYPTSWGICENWWISTGDNNAIGLLLDGQTQPSTPVQGVAGFTMTDINVQARMGSAIKVGNRGDNFVWIRTTAYTANPDPNVPAIWVAGDPATAVIGTHIWVGLTGDMRIDHPGAANGWRVIDLNMADVRSDAFKDPAAMISGAGATEVTVDSNIGYQWGQNKTLGYRESIRHDAMQFMAYDALKGLLTTVQGVWKVDSGTVADADQPGGAVQLTTDPLKGIAAILSPLGISPALRPNVVCSFFPADLWGVIYRIGWMDSLDDPPANGMYMEVDTREPWAGWRYVCRANGVQSEVDSTYPFNSGAMFQFRIEAYDVPNLGCNFAVRDYLYQFPDLKGIATNVPGPDAKLDFVVQAISLDGTAKTCRFHDLKLGFNTEQ